MKVLCEQRQVVTYVNGSLGINRCDKPRYHEEAEHYDEDKNLEWSRESS